MSGTILYCYDCFNEKIFTGEWFAKVFAYSFSSLSIIMECKRKDVLVKISIGDSMIKKNIECMPEPNLLHHSVFHTYDHIFVFNNYF